MAALPKVNKESEEVVMGTRKEEWVEPVAKNPIGYFERKRRENLQLEFDIIYEEARRHADLSVLRDCPNHDDVT